MRRSCPSYPQGMLVALAMADCCYLHWQTAYIAIHAHRHCGKRLYKGSMTTSKRWGVELNGADTDKQLWKDVLEPPHDPYVEEVPGQEGPYLALRSIEFDGLDSGSDVHEVSESLFRRLSTAFATRFHSEPVTPGAVVDFSTGEIPSRHHYLKAEPITLHIRMGHPRLTVRDAQGNVIPPPAVPSAPQKWMRAAALSPDITSAIDRLAGEPDWVELYKAFELLRDSKLAAKAISGTRLTQFTRTATTAQRHRENKFDPPDKPMSIEEARKMMVTWLEAAIAEVLSANPQ